MTFKLTLIFFFSCPGILHICSPVKAQSTNDSALIMGVEWLKNKLNGYNAERYRSGELYKEYETKMDFDYNKGSFVYEMDRKGFSMGDHFKYTIPVGMIDAGNIRIERSRCCERDPVYYETNEAEIVIPVKNQAFIIPLVLIDKDGKEYELEYKRNEFRIFISTETLKRTENLPEKCVKVIEMIIRLSN